MDSVCKVNFNGLNLVKFKLRCLQQLPIEKIPTDHIFANVYQLEKTSPFVVWYICQTQPKYKQIVRRQCCPGVMGSKKNLSDHFAFLSWTVQVQVELSQKVKVSTTLGKISHVSISATQSWIRHIFFCQTSWSWPTDRNSTKTFRAAAKKDKQEKNNFRQ